MTKALLLVDEVAKAYLDEKPSLKKLFDTTNFKIVLKNDPEYANKLIKMGNTAKAFKDIDRDMLHIVQPEFDDNIYYPLSEFNEAYTREYIDILYGFANRIGADFEYKIFNKSIHNSSSQANVSAGFNAPQANANANFNYAEDKEAMKQSEKSFSHAGNISKPFTKEELQEWIKKEKINLNILPKMYRELINRYLQTGDFSGEVKSEEIVLNENKRNQTMAFDLSANLDLLPRTFSFKLDADMKSNDFSSYYSKISINITKKQG